MHFAVVRDKEGGLRKQMAYEKDVLALLYHKDGTHGLALKDIDREVLTEAFDQSLTEIEPPTRKD